MQEHPIHGLMTTAMQNIKEMVDVNTIVGEAVQTPDGVVVIPISRVSFGFASGGGEYESLGEDNKGYDQEQSGDKKYPFAGGSGAGVTINPVAFLVAGSGQIRLLEVGENSSIEKILDSAPELMNKLGEVIRGKSDEKD